MADGREEAAVTVVEEIRCLVDAGWVWDGDRLMHPTDSTIWCQYARTDSRGIASRIGQFESEIREAVLERRRKDSRTSSE